MNAFLCLANVLLASITGAAMKNGKLYSRRVPKIKDSEADILSQNGTLILEEGTFKVDDEAHVGGL